MCINGFWPFILFKVRNFDAKWFKSKLLEGDSLFFDHQFYKVLGFFGKAKGEWDLFFASLVRDIFNSLIFFFFRTFLKLSWKRLAASPCLFHKPANTCTHKVPQ